MLNEAIHRNAMAALQAAAPGDGEVFQCEIKPYKRTRNHAQNALLWVWLDAIRKHIYESTGEAYSSEELHEAFKQKFLPTTQVRLNGKLSWVPMSTTKLSVGEMAEYLTKIEVYALTDLDCVLEKPDGMYDEAMARRYE